MEDNTKKEKMRNYMKHRRENETPEQREKRLTQAREYMRQKRKKEKHQ